MSEYKPYIDENGRLYLFSLCDGTLIFLQQLIVSLERLGCKDIRRSRKILTEGMPEGKPWMNCLYEASGRSRDSPLAWSTGCRVAGRKVWVGWP